VIEEVQERNVEVAEALGRLLPQLSSSAPSVTDEMLERLVSSDATHLLIARDAARRIVGTLTLVVAPTPSGTKGWIEDVVVDSAARGRGHGEALTRAALRLAADLGARTVDLTSRPSREAANRMYRRIGFVERETKVYRYRL
jgi:ribosomal protein S18 acetylase RimI-like enzyme